MADGVRLAEEELAGFLAGPRDSFEARLQALSGSFAVVHYDPAEREGCRAAVDPLRSVPLFYGCDGRTRFVTDDPYWLADRLQSTEMDSLSALFYLLQGVVPGEKTLLPGVNQLPAGHVLEASENGWRLAAYCRYCDRGEESRGEKTTGLEGDGLEAAVASGDGLEAAMASEDGLEVEVASGDGEDFLQEGRAVLERVGDRLIRRVAGFTPVVPLSGGLDSRLVAFLLAEGGRTDTICFSYGRQGSRDARVSRRIAQGMGLRWYFVPYTNRLWAETYRHPEYQAYRRFASRLSSIEHEQDWPAVRALKRRGWIPEDAVFVPGHSGDFLAGSHLPALLRRGPQTANPVDWVLDRYLTLWPKSGLGKEEMALLRAEIARVMGKKADTEVDLRRAVCLFDGYGLRERQAKLIVNSVRVYEFFGVGWTLPLWDPEMIAFWLDVPRSLRFEKRLYRELLGNLGPAMRQPVAGGLRPGPWEKVHRTLDLDYRRYGMYLGAHPLLSGLRHRIGDISGAPLMPLLQKVIAPFRRYPPQTRPLNALIALQQLKDLAGGCG
jgi:asparagine synthase (glutamine-hydrolysing)